MDLREGRGFKPEGATSQRPSRARSSVLMDGRASKEGRSGWEGKSDGGRTQGPAGHRRGFSFSSGWWDDTGRAEGESNVKSLSYHSEHQSPVTLSSL